MFQPFIFKMTKAVAKKPNKGKQRADPIVNSDSNENMGTQKLFLRLKIPAVTPASSLEDEVPEHTASSEKVYLRLPASSFKPKRKRRMIERDEDSDDGGFDNVNLETSNNASRSISSSFGRFRSTPPKRSRQEIASYQRQYQADHRQQLADYSEQYRESHAQQYQEYQRTYREEHSQDISQYRRLYGQEHREENAQSQQRHRESRNNEAVNFDAFVVEHHTLI